MEDMTMPKKTLVNQMDFVSILGGLLFTATATLVITYIVGRLTCKMHKRSKETTKAANLKNQPERPSADQQSIPGGSNTTSKQRVKSQKRREMQQAFQNSWLIGTLKGHTGLILDMNLSQNGKYLASSAEDRSVMLWCVKNLVSKDRRSLRVNIKYDHATLIRWSPDGKAFIVHKAMANTIEVYKVAKKSDGFLASATKALEFPKRHTEDVVGMDIACTGKYIITCSKANDLIIWDLKGQPLATVELHLGSTYRARLSPCSRFVVVSGFTPDVNAFEVVFKQGEFKQVVKAFNLAGHMSGVHDFGFNADTSQIATVSKDGTYRFYNIKIEFENEKNPRLLTTGTWDTRTPASLVLSPNGEVLVIAHGSSISFYSTITGALDNSIEDLFLGPITCLAFEATGEYLLVSGDKHIKIFRNITGYRTAIETAKRKLELKQTQATRERLQKIIHDNTELLTKMGEKCPCY